MMNIRVLYGFCGFRFQDINIDENHRKTKFPMILMKFNMRNSFFEPINYHIILIF